MASEEKYAEAPSRTGGKRCREIIENDEVSTVTKTEWPSSFWSSWYTLCTSVNSKVDRDKQWKRGERTDILPLSGGGVYELAIVNKHGTFVVKAGRARTKTTLRKRLLSKYGKGKDPIFADLTLYGINTFELQARWTLLKTDASIDDMEKMLMEYYDYALCEEYNTQKRSPIVQHDNKWVYVNDIMSSRQHQIQGLIEYVRALKLTPQELQEFISTINK